MAPNELFANLPVPTSADPMFKPISNDGKVTSQLHDTFSVDIRRQLNERVAFPSVIMGTEFWAVR